jgi:hypothetical protein
MKVTVNSNINQIYTRYDSVVDKPVPLTKVGRN